MTPSPHHPATPDGDARERRAACRLLSVIPAKAGVHASFHARTISETAPPPQRVMDPGRRRDDVAGVAAGAAYPLLILNESLFS